MIRESQFAKFFLKIIVKFIAGEEGNSSAVLLAVTAILDLRGSKSATRVLGGKKVVFHESIGERALARFFQPDDSNLELVVLQFAMNPFRFIFKFFEFFPHFCVHDRARIHFENAVKGLDLPFQLFNRFLFFRCQIFCHNNPFLLVSLPFKCQNTDFPIQCV